MAHIESCPFLTPPETVVPNSLALLHLRRDHILPVYLSDSPTAVEHTRFGSFPHSTLLGLKWGSQVPASHVKGSHATVKRSRNSQQQVRTLAGSRRKRLNGEIENDDETADTGVSTDAKAFEISQSASGFAHILAPTAELWTQSLPHRTQVVYTPDYSYILSRLKVRPGSRLIEAGAGSGSFTHAAVRASFSGYEDVEFSDPNSGTKRRRPRGKVFSYECHGPRVQPLRDEIAAHGMEQLVTLTHRDVYADGFCFPDEDSEQPCATAVFLDLPSPWLALVHLTRASPSPLNSKAPVHICTFSPCIEQVTRTIEKLRELGYVNISMVEIMHRRLDVRREHIGLDEEGVRGANIAPKNVDESIQRIRELNQERDNILNSQIARTARARAGIEAAKGGKVDGDGDITMHDGDDVGVGNGDAEMKGNGKAATNGPLPPPCKPARREKASAKNPERKRWKEGRLVHRTEPELKTHTSYLVFAILPRTWTEQDEEDAARRVSECFPKGRNASGPSVKGKNDTEK